MVLKGRVLQRFLVGNLTQVGQCDVKEKISMLADRSEKWEIDGVFGQILV